MPAYQFSLETLGFVQHGTKELTPQLILLDPFLQACKNQMVKMLPEMERSVVSPAAENNFSKVSIFI